MYEEGKCYPPATAEELDEFEIPTGFKLPRRYREFIKVFGPGELSEFFYFYAPRPALRRTDQGRVGQGKTRPARSRTGIATARA